MIELSTRARVNADNSQWSQIKFIFDEQEPYIIEMIIGCDTEKEVSWDIGRTEMRDAILTDWPSGLSDIIMIRFERTLRMYLKNETERCSLDFEIEKLRPFLIETYNIISHRKEQAMIEDEIDKWI